jgi:Acetyltransferases, including N-acetylases of ribosomal proteins
MRETIRTERLTLRPLRDADAGPITLYCSQFRVASMLARVPHPYPPGAAESFIERARAGRSGETVWAIDGAASGAADFLGVIGMKAGVDERGFGYWIGPPAWGLGYATEAAAGVLGAAFAETPLKAAEAGVYHDNLASRRVLEKLGFAPVAETEEFCPARGAMVPSTRMRLDRAGWLAATPDLSDAAE